MINEYFDKKVGAEDIKNAKLLTFTSTVYFELTVKNVDF